jgi:Rrf2 family protein
VDRIINVSDRSNAAIHALALAAAREGPLTASACARELGVSPSYLAKVLQALVRGGFLSSTRGAAGGFELAREASGLDCLEIIEYLDGALPGRECFFPKAVCAAGTCALKAMCDRAEKALREVLESTTIAALAASFKL